MTNSNYAKDYFILAMKYIVTHLGTYIQVFTFYFSFTYFWKENFSRFRTAHIFYPIIYSSVPYRKTASVAKYGTKLSR